MAGLNGGEDVAMLIDDDVIPIIVASVGLGVVDAALFECGEKDGVNLVA